MTNIRILFLDLYKLKTLIVKKTEPNNRLGFLQLKLTKTITTIYIEK